MRYPEWTDEKLKALTADNLRNLLDRAKERNVTELASRCEAELAGRQEPGRKGKKQSSSAIRDLENQVAEELGAFMVELSKEYDLSAEAAKHLSIGTKHFMAHKLTDPKGHAKTGGLQKAGRCEIDRFISYRVRDTVISLTAWLPKGHTPNQIEFHVYGPPDLLEFARSLKELRPGMTEFEGSNLYNHGQRYLDIADAKEKMRSLIDKFAPKK